MARWGQELPQPRVNPQREQHPPGDAHAAGLAPLAPASTERRGAVNGGAGVGVEDVHKSPTWLDSVRMSAKG